MKIMSEKEVYARFRVVSVREFEDRLLKQDGDYKFHLAKSNFPTAPHLRKMGSGNLHKFGEEKVVLAVDEKELMAKRLREKVAEFIDRRRS